VPGPPCPADGHGKRRTGAMRFHRRDRLTAIRDEEPDMPTYLPFDRTPPPLKTAGRPKSIDSQFHVLGPLGEISGRPGAAYQMPTRPGSSIGACTKALGIERASSCRQRPMALIIPWCSMPSRRMGPNYALAANALGVCRSQRRPILAKLHDAGVAVRVSVSGRSSARVLSDKDFAPSDRANARKLGWVRKDPAGRRTASFQRRQIRKPRPCPC